MATIQFLGATQTVTGSKHLVEVDGYRVLVDCGLFQGLKELRRRNWEPCPVDPASLNAVILTHAHIDHSGYLPRLTSGGFAGAVYATPATAELAQIMLPDSARIQEEDAEYANRKGYAKHSPALPLYTERDARAALRLLRPVGYGQRVELGRHLSFELIPAGHILGSGFVCFDLKGGGRNKRLVLSGDIGRYDEPIIPDPSKVAWADHLVLESTYGNRAHPEVDVKAQLAAIINETAARSGQVIIPAFAVGRTQQLIYFLRELEDEARIPVLPVFVDSPMAVQATRLYLKHEEDHDLDMQALLDEKRNPLATRRFHLARSVAESKAVTAGEEPAIVIAASGMATGGRVLHHLARRLPDERHTVIFAGFQAAGTRGRRLVDGEPEVRIHGRMVPVRARVEQIDNLSAHADYREILRWLGYFERAPERVFLVHGEPEAAEVLKVRIEERYGWRVDIPSYLERFEL